MNKTIEEWKAILPDHVFNILWGQETEPPFTGNLIDEKRPGIYRCAGCGNELFNSASKFDSGSGWPSFTEPLSSKSISTSIDNSFGMNRIEVLCASCGGHLGHVFDDGPKPSGKRYCINSAALTFIKHASIP